MQDASQILQTTWSAVQVSEFKSKIRIHPADRDRSPGFRLRHSRLALRLPSSEVSAPEY